MIAAVFRNRLCRFPQASRLKGQDRYNFSFWLFGSGRYLTGKSLLLLRLRKVKFSIYRHIS